MYVVISSSFSKRTDHPSGWPRKRFPRCEEHNKHHQRLDISMRVPRDACATGFRCSTDSRLIDPSIDRYLRRTGGREVTVTVTVTSTRAAPCDRRHSNPPPSSSGCLTALDSRLTDLTACLQSTSATRRSSWPTSLLSTVGSGGWAVFRSDGLGVEALSDSAASGH